MYTITRARRAREDTGRPLPDVFSCLAAEGVHVRRGQLGLIAAAPGAGKSAVALKISVELAKIDVPVYYFSADSDAFTTYVRAAAMLTEWSTRDIEYQIGLGRTSLFDVRLSALGALRLSFEPAPSIADVAEELDAFALVYGCYPALVVVDNLSNVWNPDGGEGYAALEDTCAFLHEKARETGAAVLALHHVTGEYDNGTTAVPMSGLRGKVSKVPELILTLYRLDDTRLGVCPVKNRSGRSDPSGRWVLPISADMERMRLEG